MPVTALCSDEEAPTKSWDDNDDPPQSSERELLTRTISNETDFDKALYVSTDSFDSFNQSEHSLIESIALERLQTDYAPQLDGKRLHVMHESPQVKELQTIIRNRDTNRSDFVFSADRLIRMVIETGLNQLPFHECTVQTHSGVDYSGLHFEKGICGVSIVRSGEAMEKGLRECCRKIRIGKVLINKDEEMGDSVLYAKFPPDVERRKVLLMYPLLRTGSTVELSIDILLEYGVPQDAIYVLTLFATPTSLLMLFSKFPDIHLLTTEINIEAPTQFGKKYFGTE